MKLYAGRSSTASRRIKVVFQHARQAAVNGALIIFVRRAVSFGQQPHFKRETRRVRRQRDEVIVFADHPFAGVALLANHVAENAALFFVVVVPATVHFFAHAARNDRQRDQLRMGMLQRSAGGLAVIFENQDVAEALVVFQVEHAVAVRPQNVFDSAFSARLRERRGVIRRFDDHFVRADAIHLVEQAFAFAIEVAFDAQRRKFIRHDANATSPACLFAAAVAAVHQNFR